MNQDYILINS